MYIKVKLNIGLYIWRTLVLKIKLKIFINQTHHKFVITYWKVINMSKCGKRKKKEEGKK